KKRKCSDGTVRKDLHTALGFINGVLSLVEQA
ncbi:TPA: antitermination protein, partial [Enterobacter kobei]